MTNITLELEGNIHGKNTKCHGKPSIREETERLEKIHKKVVNKVFWFYLPQHTRRCNCVENNTRKYLFTNCVNNLWRELPDDM